MAPSAEDDNILRIRTNEVAQATSVVADGPWELIRAAREAADLSSAEVAHRSRVSELTVDAIENGRLEQLPFGDAGAREVQQVCRTLKLEPAEFEDAFLARRPAPLSSSLRTQKPPRRRFSWIIVVIVIWILIIGGAVAARFVVTDDGNSDAATTAAPTTVTTTAPPTTAPPVTEPPPPPVAFAVSLGAARSDTWVQAEVNGETQFIGTIPQGETRDWSGDTVKLTIGRPSAVDLTVNGQPHTPERQVNLGG